MYSWDFGSMDMDDDFEIIAGLAAAVLSKRYYGDFVAQQC
jgi:hypothetical protein